MMRICAKLIHAFILIHLDHAGLFDLNQLIKIIDLNQLIKIIDLNHDLNQGKK